MWQKSRNRACGNTADRNVIKVSFFNNKVKVAQITINKHKSVSSKLYVDNVPSKIFNAINMIDQ